MVFLIIYFVQFSEATTLTPLLRLLQINVQVIEYFQITCLGT